MDEELKKYYTIFLPLLISFVLAVGVPIYLGLIIFDNLFYGIAFAVALIYGVTLPGLYWVADKLLTRW